MIQPLISIIIPVFNRSYCIENTLESVFLQTYENYEIIVVDDGSTDNLVQTLAPYKKKITYLYQRNKGQSAARNLGLTLAKGAYIAPLDSDDIWYEDYLENAMKEIEKHKFNLYISDWLQAEETKKGFTKSFLPKESVYTSPKVFSQRIFKDNLGANSGMVLKKDLLENGWNENIAIGDDWYLLIELVLRKSALKIGFSKEPRWIKNRISDNVCDGKESELFRLAHLKDIETIISEFKNELSLCQLESLNLKRFQNLLLLTSYNIKYSKNLLQIFTPFEHCKLFFKAIINVIYRLKRVYAQRVT